ncbi:MAG: hypothetical protein WCU80_00430 [Paludibacteraceae bacterium]|nr:hypothetical protein [Prevotellaceae bacterium]
MNIFLMFNKLGRCVLSIIKELCSYMGFLLRKTFKYKWLLLLFWLAAIGYSLFQTTGSRKIYEGDMILSIHDGSSSFYADMLSTLDKYVKDKDSEGLAAALDIPDTLAMKVRYIKPHFLIDVNKDSIYDMVDYSDKYEASDSVYVRMKDGINVTLGMGDVRSFPAMETALVSYFMRNRYLQDLNMSRISYLDEMEKSLKKDLVELDSLQRLEYFERSTNGVNILKDLKINTDKQMFYFNKEDILKKKKSVSGDLLSKAEVVSVSKSYQPTFKSVNSKIKVAFGNCLKAYLLFLIVALLFDYRKSILDYLNRN